MSSERAPIPVMHTGRWPMKIGSVLTIASGILSLLNGAQGFLFGGEFPFAELPTLPHFQACGAILIILGTVAIAGGIATLLLKRISPALAGALCGMLGGGLIGFWLSLAALLLLAFSDEDF